MRNIAAPLTAFSLLLITLGSPSELRADGAQGFVFAGPSITAADSAIGARTDCPFCAKAPGAPSGRENAAPLIMLGTGVVGSEGAFRGGGELISIIAPARRASGFSAFLTYGGLDFGPAFVQTGLGIGAFWGGDATGLDRIGGIAHVELGLRLVDGFSLLARGDYLLASGRSNVVGSLGIQWIPAALDNYL